jgi:hypothetical protein
VRWNIKINEGKTQAIYFSRRLRVPEDVLQVNGQDIPFVNNTAYLGVNFDRRMRWRLHIETNVDKALRKYLRNYSVLKRERQITNIKLTLYKNMIRSVTTYAGPT